jgi:hypothetical protein
MRLYLAAAVLALAMPLLTTHVVADPPDFSLPDQALYGVCTAWSHNGTGREHGRAGDAPPFAELQELADEADQTVEEFCAEQTPGGR